jgi:peptidoglycan hydrolase-like protein with peptidoglycan-binding domain
MPSDFQAFSQSGCFNGNFEDVGISASVGNRGANLPPDVRHVQALLNGIAPDQGGPQPELKVDGIVGPFTLRAISRFQSKHLGFSDGRVDPGGRTIAELEERSEADSSSFDASKPKAAPSSPTTTGNSVQAQTIRRAIAISVIPDARLALAKALLELDQIRLRLSRATPVFPASKADAVLNHHFATAALSANAKRTSLLFIQSTLASMKAVLEGRKGFFGGDPFGPNMIEADPIPPPPPKDIRNAFAYSPTQAGDKKRQKKLGVSPSRVYFTSLIDGRSRDFFLYALLHELAHFVDDEKVAAIKDHAYGHQDSYLTLPHVLRMRNAECFALLVFELFGGNERLAQIYPKLRVIEIDPVIIR